MISSEFVTALQAVLPGYIAKQRWFRAKTRLIESVHVADILSGLGENLFLLIIEVAYNSGAGDRYLLPIAIDKQGRPQEESIAAIGEANVYSPLFDEGFRTALLKTLFDGATLNGRNGRLEFSPTLALPAISAYSMPSFVSRAEQSNTSLVYGDKFILKLFRKLEAGVNPDVEIGRFLTERGFLHTPSVYGSLEYHALKSEPCAAGILQQFVSNQGDAWKYTLEQLAFFFNRAATHASALPPAVPSRHPLELCVIAPAPEVRALFGEYYDSARLLGARTAEMHAALAAENGPPDFVPEPFSTPAAQALQHEFSAQANLSFDLLRRMLPILPAAAAADASEVLACESNVRTRLDAIHMSSIPAAARIRLHGDYHLGQVLFTGNDFTIIDFEGEPARPLAERRAKGLALRDVAGMLRSFHYAAYAALFGQVPAAIERGWTSERIESWAAFWNSWISAAFLSAYLEAAQPSPPASFRSEPASLRPLLDAFLFQKALYEVAYELNNRPGWVRIPLRGILDLIA